MFFFDVWLQWRIWSILTLFFDLIDVQVPRLENKWRLMGLVPFSTKEVRTCQVSKKSKLVATNGYPHGWWGTDTLLFVFFCLSFVCLLWLLFVFWLSFVCLVVVIGCLLVVFFLSCCGYCLCFVGGRTGQVWHVGARPRQSPKPWSGVWNNT